MVLYMDEITPSFPCYILAIKLMRAKSIYELSWDYDEIFFLHFIQNKELVFILQVPFFLSFFFLNIYDI